MQVRQICRMRRILNAFLDAIVKDPVGKAAALNAAQQFTSFGHLTDHNNTEWYQNIQNEGWLIKHHAHLYALYMLLDRGKVESANSKRLILTPSETPPALRSWAGGRDIDMDMIISGIQKCSTCGPIWTDKAQHDFKKDADGWF